MQFAKEFGTTCKAVFLEVMTDPRVRELFVREQLMHREEHGMDPKEPCCLLKMLEEDYNMPFDKSKLDNNDYKLGSTPHTKAVADGVFKHMLVEFGIKCGACGGSHEFKVVR